MSSEKIKQPWKELPKQFQWKTTKGTLWYAESFIKALRRLKTKEIVCVIEKLYRFCIQGPSAPSLQTHKTVKGFVFPQTPIGAMVSRFNRSLRFSWYLDGLSIIICNLFRKGDSRLPY